MELRIAKVNNDDLIVRPILKDFYCRYCCSVSKCMTRPHRSGFCVVFEVVLGNKRWLVIDGFGESERGFVISEFTDDWKMTYTGMSGAQRFYSYRLNLYHHITCGGWHRYVPLPCIIALDEKLERKLEELKQVDRYQITTSDLPVIMKLLRSNIIRKYKIFEDVDINEVEFYFEFADLLPLLKAYKRSRKLKFSQNASLVELPNCFTSVFRLKDIEFKIPKKANYLEFVFQDQVRINLTKDLFIVYKYDRVQDKAIVYVVDKMNSCFIVTGYEQYQNVLHRPISLSMHRERSFVEKILDVFFDYRLGDVLFIPLDKPIFSEVIEYFMPARAQQFGKMIIKNAEIVDNDILRPKSDGSIEVFHPEHGVLKLEPTTDYKCLTFTTMHD